MKKILISLEKDFKRRELFFSQKHTSDFQVFNAINLLNRNLDDLYDMYDMAQFEKLYHRMPAKGEIGCTLSHLAIYKEVADNLSLADNDYILICEDDALFVEDFNENLSNILKSINNDIDILLLGQSKIDNFNDVELEVNYPTTFWFMQKKIVGSRVRYSYPYLNYYAGTVAYLISKKGAKKIIELLSIYGSPYWLADDFRLFQMHDINTMIVRPLLVIENPKLDSNLEKDRNSRKVSNLSKILKYPIKKILALWRNLKN